MIIRIFSVLPRITSFEFEPVIKGQSAQATCHVFEGDLPLEIFWTFQGNSLPPQSGITISKIGKRDSFLIIDPVYPIDAGNYTCIVKNMAGSVTHTAELMVQGILLIK